MRTFMQPVLIIGVGPAGLTAAYELARRGIRMMVVERADKVGGLACTESYQGFRFDMGGHRFSTKSQAVHAIWKDMLGEQLLLRHGCRAFITIGAFSTIRFVLSTS